MTRRIDILRAKMTARTARAIYEGAYNLASTAIPAKLEQSDPDVFAVAVDIRRAYAQSANSLRFAMWDAEDVVHNLERAAREASWSPDASGHAIVRAARKGRYRPSYPHWAPSDTSELSHAGKAVAQAVHWMVEWAKAHPEAKFVVHGRDGDVIFALAKESRLRVRYVLSSRPRTSDAHDPKEAQDRALRGIRGFESAVHVDSGYKGTIPAWFASLPGVAVEAVYLVSTDRHGIVVDPHTPVFSPNDDVGCDALEGIARAFSPRDDGGTQWHGRNLAERAAFEFAETLEYARIHLLCYEDCVWKPVHERSARRTP